MKTTVLSLLAALSVLGLVLWTRASNADEKRASPHEKVTATVGGVKVTVEYGRPFKKGRDIFGGLVPYGEVWRTGADEATTITTEGDLAIGDLKLPKGTYGLFTLPAKDKWLLIVNKQPKQWGAFKYDAKEDFGRTDLKVGAPAAPVEQFTIAITPAGEKKATLELSWDKTVASVPLVAK